MNRIIRYIVRQDQAITVTIASITTRTLRCAYDSCCFGHFLETADRTSQQLIDMLVVPRLALVVLVVVPRLALVVLVDTHTDPAGLHMHEEEEDTVDGMAVAVAGILPLEDSLHRHHWALHPNMKVEGMGNHQGQGQGQAVAVGTQHLLVDHVQTIVDS
jgi:hypothetical protein